MITRYANIPIEELIRFAEAEQNLLALELVQRYENNLEEIQEVVCLGCKEALIEENLLESP